MKSLKDFLTSRVEYCGNVAAYHAARVDKSSKHAPDAAKWQIARADAARWLDDYTTLVRYVNTGQTVAAIQLAKELEK